MAAAKIGSALLSHEKSTAADFLRERVTGSVLGAQPKLLVRKPDGRYVAGLTISGFLERHGICHYLLSSRLSTASELRIHA